MQNDTTNEQAYFCRSTTGGQRLTRQAIEEERALLCSLMNNIPDSIYFKDTQSRFIRVNWSQARHLGLKDPEQALGKTDFDFFSEEHARQAYQDEQEIVRSGRSIINKEEEETWPNGQKGWVTSTKMPLFDANGALLGTFGISHDITDRKLAELALQSRLSELEIVNRLSSSVQTVENEKDLLRILLTEAVDAVRSEAGCVCLIDAQDDTLSIFTGTGWFASLIGQPIHPEKEKLHSILAGHKPYRAHGIETASLGVTPLPENVPAQWDGAILPIVCSEGPIGVLVVTDSPRHALNDDDIRLLSIILQLVSSSILRTRLYEQVHSSLAELKEEIHQRKTIQDLLAAEKEIIATTLMSIGEGVIATDKEGLVILINRTAEEIIGYQSAEVLDRPLDSVFKLIHSDSGQTIPDIIESLYQMDSRQKENPDYHAPTLITRSGKRLLVQGNVSAILSQNRGLVGYVIVFQNITQQHQIEANSILSQKMEAIGQLAAGIAHEINTPIQYVGDNLGFLGRAFAKITEMLEVYQQTLQAHAGAAIDPAEIERLEEEARLRKIAIYTQEVPDAIQEALEGIERVRKIVLAIREFSHPSQKEKSYADINHGIETTVTLSRNEWKYCAEMETDLAQDLPPVLCQIDEINQVILNMIINASQAIQEVLPQGSDQKGTIRIQTRYQNGKARISIRDSGCGIPLKIRERIFDPFFTTKGVGKGTGQGLSMAHNIVVKKHGGMILVDSQEGKGTTFTIELPVDG